MTESCLRFARFRPRPWQRVGEFQTLLLLQANWPSADKS